MTDAIDYQTESHMDVFRVEFPNGLAFEIPHDEREDFVNFNRQILTEMSMPIEIESQVREILRDIEGE